MKKTEIAYTDANKVLAEITGDIVGYFDLSDLLDKVVSLVMRLLQAEVCSIFLEDKEKNPGRIRMVAGSGFAKTLVGKAEYEIGEGFTGFIAQTGRKFNIRNREDLQNLSHEGKFLWKGTFDSVQWPSARNEFRSLLAMPLKIKNHIFGVIKVENKDIAFGPYFSKEDECIFEMIANVVALAIENAKFHSRVETQLKAISAKAAHRINNQAANYDGIDLDFEEELENPICNKDNLRKIHKKLIETTTSLKRMTGEFRNLGKPMSLNRKHLSINDIVRDAAWFAKPPDYIKIELCLDETIPHVLIDERMSESIGELIRNAITALSNKPQKVEKHGLIRITTEYDEKIEKRYVNIKVDDNGPGFPPKFPVFEPFNSTDPKSSGLGLSTVKELIEMHNGTIRAISSDLGGACIKLNIPITD